MSDRPATVTSKMQLTIPKAIVQALGLQRGDKLVFTVQGKRLIATPLRQGGRMSRPRHSRTFSWYACFGYVLLDEAERLLEFDTSEDDLAQRFAAEVHRLPADQQHHLAALVQSDTRLLAAPPDQLSLLSTVLRRVLAGLGRDSRRPGQQEAA